MIEYSNIRVHYTIQLSTVHFQINNARPIVVNFQTNTVRPNAVHFQINTVQPSTVYFQINVACPSVVHFQNLYFMTDVQYISQKFAFYDRVQCIYSKICIV